MKYLYNSGLLALCAFALFACTKEPAAVQEGDPFDGTPQEETITRTITISQDLNMAPKDLKTTIDSDGDIAWESGDMIYYYDYYYQDETLNKSGKKNIAISESAKNVALDLSIRKASVSVALIMPGKDQRDTEKNKVLEYDPTAFVYSGINPDQDGSFAFANIAVAHSNDAQAVTGLTFKNIASILKFSVTEDQKVNKVTLQPNSKVDGNQISGRINVDLTAEDPSAIYYSNYPAMAASRSYEAVIDKGDEVMNGTYYIAVMPTTLEDGFTLTFNDGLAQAIDGMTYTKQKYTAGTTSEVVFQANKIKNVGNPILNKRITSFTIEQIKTDNSWVHGTKYPTFSVDNLITFSAIGNNGYYYAEESATKHYWRCYQARDNGEFSVSCPQGRNISSITVSFNQANGGALQYNGATYMSPATITPATATNSLTFTVVSTTGKTNGQVSIKEVTIETK